MAEKVIIIVALVAAIGAAAMFFCIISEERNREREAEEATRSFEKAMQELEKAAGLAANTEPVKRKDTDQGASQAEPQRVGKPSSEDKKPVKYERFRMKRRDVTVNLKPQREEDRTQDRGRE